MKSTIATLVAPRTYEFIEEELPKCGDKDMIIKMEAVGLCHSDLPGYLGTNIVAPNKKYNFREPGIPKYPAVVGHEAVATVIEVGKDVTKFKVGDHVAGRVRQCHRDYMFIPNADVLQPTIQLFKLPETDKDWKCCLIEPMECVVNIARIANPMYGDYVAVVGCGVMGLLTIAALKDSGCKKLVAVDMLDDKLAMAKELGATDIINPRNVENLSEKAYEMTEGNFFDIVIEISGSIRGLDSALQMVKHTHKDGHASNMYKGNGRVLIPSVYTKEETFPARLGFNLMVKAPIIQTVHPTYSIDPVRNDYLGRDAFFSGSLPMEKMITHRVPFKEIAKAMEYLVTPPEGYIKGIITFD